ncbi:MAG TPA: PEP-CTERM sorting domain-containing protein [Pseudoduganella sp.]
MRTLFVALAASLLMQVAHADSINSRSGGTLQDFYGLYGSGTGPYTLEVRSDFDPANVYGGGDQTYIFIYNAKLDIALTYNGSTLSFTTDGSMILNFAGDNSSKVYSQNLFYGYDGYKYLTTLNFHVDAAQFPDNRPLTPAIVHRRGADDAGNLSFTRFGGFEDDVRILGDAYGSADWYELAVTTAVPEPYSYAMLIAGLAVVGGVARRRTSAA